jgi:hypothetical protein
VFWACGSGHIEWPLPKAICRIFWEVEPEATPPNHRRWVWPWPAAGQRGFLVIGPDLFLHAIQLCDPFDGLLGDGGTLRGKHVDKFASDVGHAGHLGGFIHADHIIEPGIAIRMHPALVARQVADGMLTLSIHCVLFFG